MPLFNKTSNSKNSDVSDVKKRQVSIKNMDMEMSQIQISNIKSNLAAVNSNPSVCQVCSSKMSHRKSTSPFPNYSPKVHRKNSEFNSPNSPNNNHQSHNNTSNYYKIEQKNTQIYPLTNSPLIPKVDLQKLGTQKSDFKLFSNKENFPRNARYILVVDDDLSCRRSTANLVNLLIKKYSLKDYHSMRMMDGIDVLSAVIEDQKNYSQIKMIVSDENMAFLNGSDAFHLMNKLVNANKLKKVPWIILTALENDNELKAIQKYSNCDKIIKKPANKAMIEGVFKEFLIG